MTVKAGVIVGPLAKRHFKRRFAGGPIMARHVMLAWYMCVALRFSKGSNPVLLKKHVPPGSAHDKTASISKLNCVQIESH